MSRRGDSAVGQCRLVISEPKTTNSRCEVPLHATTVAMLRKHRIAQMEERMAAANVWISGARSSSSAPAVVPRRLWKSASYVFVTPALSQATRALGA
jgi:hypothetical protein